MDLYAKGQLSFLILNCLLERDYYGLDLISEIYNKSNGRIELKKPSVYSNLTRMEKQGYVSSYLRSSDLGPNRKYYSITERGRSFYQDLKDYFDRNNIDVFRDFNEFDSSPDTNNKEESVKLTSMNNSANEEIRTESIYENSANENSDYFDFSSIDEDSTNASSVDIEQKENEIYTEGQHNKLQTDTYSINSQYSNMNITSNDKNDFVEKVNKQDVNENIQEKVNENKNESIQNISTETNKEETKKDDAVFLNSKDVEDYNKRLYDISKDINRYRRKKSFAEDQIAFQVDNYSPISEANERTKSNIEDFKNSLLESKGKASVDNHAYSRQISYRFNKDNLSYQDILNSSKNQKREEHFIDDGKFITNRYDESQVEHAKKIEPPRLKIMTENSKDNYKMPPPNRDKSIDPSHKEILSRLYSKTKTSNDNEVREDALYDYNDLKDFYRDQNISFSEYRKPAEKTEHNTNLLYLVVSLVTFFVSAVFSGVLYAILLSSNLINNNTSFLYILLPALLLIDIAVRLYNYKKYKSWMPNPLLQQWKIWAVALLISAVVVGLNFICGMNPSNFSEFATTTILPIILAFVIFPFRYYFNRFLLIKYWR